LYFHFINCDSGQSVEQTRKTSGTVSVILDNYLPFILKRRKYV